MLVKRESNIRSNSLNTVYRPCTVDEILGNDENKKLLNNHLKNNTLPHTLLFSGPAGCGKTTAARVVALGLNCEEAKNSTPKPCLACRSCKSILNGSNLDIHEINVGRDGGKDAVTKLVKDLPAAPFSTRRKVLIFDESHKLTEAAKDLLLKEIEDGYAHVYFIFCTNQPDALKSKKKGGDAFLSRCSKMKFDILSFDEIKDMLINVVQFEGQDYNEEVVDYIAKETKGVPRDALVILGDVIGEGSWSIQTTKKFLGVLVDEDDPELIALCRALNGGEFKTSSNLYDTLVKKIPAEGIRIALCGYFVACLKKSKNNREAQKFSSILDVIINPIYEVVGKPADYMMYNKMYKITDIINLEKFKKVNR